MKERWLRCLRRWGKFLRMEQQLSFPGLEPSSSRKHILYVALLPDDRSTQLIASSREQVEQAHGPLGKLVPLELLHMSLVFVKEFDDHVPASVIKMASDGCKAAANVPPFPISLDCMESWSHLVMRAIEAPALMEFQASLLKSIRHQGLRCDGNPKFSPHLTLIRNSRKIPRHPIPPITWNASEIVLVDSVDGTHIHLGRWPLSVAP
jgi:RNA 2',3'-cyclic 3'-phosphodiesterase